MTKIIGIAGGTASGKTSILHKLADELGSQAQIIYMDAYYHSYDQYSFEDKLHLNYDHPKAFDIELLVRHLKDLKAGKSIDMPVYDYVKYERKKERKRVAPAQVILLEGLFVLYYESLKPLLDLKVYVQADPDIRLIRRIRRDQIERGRSLESILKQYTETIKPMHEAFVAPTKKEADIIIPRGVENEKGVNILITHVKNLSSKKEGENITEL